METKETEKQETRNLILQCAFWRSLFIIKEKEKNYTQNKNKDAHY